MKYYNNILKELRKEKNMLQKDVANALGTSQQIYSRYELGFRILSVEQLIVLCKLYDVSADYILGLKDEK